MITQLTKIDDLGKANFLIATLIDQLEKATNEKSNWYFKEGCWQCNEESE